MGYIGANTRKFFHPAAANEMLSVFVPLLNGTDLNVRRPSRLSIELRWF
jgi:proteasome activator subunit 4